MSKRKRPKAPNGSGSVYERPDGSYRASVPVGWLPNGNAKRLTKVFESRKEADAWRMQTVLDRDRGALVMPDTSTLSELVDRWEEAHPHWAPSTVADRVGTLRRHVLPYLGDVQVAKLKPGEVAGLLGVLRRERANPVPGAKPKTLPAVREHTIHRTVRHLRACLDYAVSIELAKRNVTAGIKTTAPAPAKRVRWSIEETRDVLAAAAEYGLTHSIGNYLYVALMTGMRREELRGLRWEDVDADRLLVSVRQVVTEVDGVVHYGPPKTEASERDVPVDAGTVLAFERQKVVQFKQREAAKDSWEERDLVFTNRNGGPLRYKQLRHHLNIISAQAGVDPIRLYDTRSTHGSILAETGVNPKAISERLGHTDVGFTLRTYVRTSESEGRAIAQAMGALGPRVQPCATGSDSSVPGEADAGAERQAEGVQVPGGKGSVSAVN